MKKGIFVYPWSFGEDIQGTVKQIKALGCNSIAVGTSYHHINALDLREKHFHTRYDSGVPFSVDKLRYHKIIPKCVEKNDKIYSELKNVTIREDMSLAAWIVLTHNSTSGMEYPDCAVQNAWGDVYENALCINNVDVLTYSKDLIANVIGVMNPDTLIVEAATWMPSFHGRIHEFGLAHISDALRYLLSGCFCPACIRKAEQYGLDLNEVKRLFQQLLDKLINCDSSLNGKEANQLLQIFLRYPIIYKYEQFRQRSVHEFIKTTADYTHKFRVKYILIPSSTPFDFNTNWYEGTPCDFSIEEIDGYLPLLYNRDERYGLLKANYSLLEADNVPISAAFNLSRDKWQSKEQLAAKFREASREGAPAIYCYNYAMATNEMLSWMRDAYYECD